MWGAITTLIVMGFIFAIAVAICYTVRSLQRADQKAIADKAMREANRELERLMFIDKMHERASELKRQGIQPPAIPPDVMKARPTQTRMAQKDGHTIYYDDIYPTP